MKSDLTSLHILSRFREARKLRNLVASDKQGTHVCGTIALKEIYGVAWARRKQEDERVGWASQLCRALALRF